jgi:hypothetical protein
MSLIYKLMLALAGFTTLAVVAGFFLAAILSQIDPGSSNIGQGPGPVENRGPQGAPGPLVGAGLPVLAIAGGGYWLVRRYRRKARRTLA